MYLSHRFLAVIPVLKCFVAISSVLVPSVISKLRLLDRIPIFGDLQEKINEIRHWERQKHFKHCFDIFLVSLIQAEKEASEIDTDRKRERDSTDFKALKI